MHDPGRTAPVATIDDGDNRYTMIAHDGMHVGQEVSAGHGAEIKIGNTSYLGSIPEGTRVYNVELKPGDGGKLARSAGQTAVVISHGKQTTVRLPSKAQKTLDNMCRATVGAVAGSGRGEKPIAKAGKNFYRNRARPKVWPKVRGVAMNAVDHPHGSGRKQTVGVQSTVSRNAPPGRKVGHVAAKRTGGKR
tara:strand:- start:492 stop:1064 length:573 start_codon:yes stop_codon:yes gene_type:complete